MTFRVCILGVWQAAQEPTKGHKPGSNVKARRYAYWSELCGFARNLERIVKFIRFDTLVCDVLYRIWGNLIKIWKPLSTEDLLCLNSILALAVILRSRFFVSYIKLRKVAARYSGTQEQPGEARNIFHAKSHLRNVFYIQVCYDLA